MIQILNQLSEYDENALYFLTFQVNLSKTQSIAVENSIDRIFAICAAKRTIYIEYYDIDCEDNLREISFDDIEQYATYDELQLVLLQMKKQLYTKSYIDFIYKYESTLLDALLSKDFAKESEAISEAIATAILKFDEDLISYSDFFAETNAFATAKEKTDLIAKYIEKELSNLYTKNVILTVAVEIEHIQNIDIEELSIEDIIFSNKEVLNVTYVNCDLAEEV